mmetsp:Transcript_45172/g.104676  ORF Transcript_45172/g.104676 Transcript_45172/m.104676 type:complete len:209 (+) Transcript_45172:1040-1666(+)
MEGQGVLVVPLTVQDIMMGEPCSSLLSLHICDQIPRTCNEVVRGQEHRYHLCQVRKDTCILRVQLFVERLHNPLQLDQADETQGPRQAQDTQELYRGPSCTTRGVACRANYHKQSKDPIWQQNSQVYPKPTSEVSCGDQLWLHDGDSVVHISECKGCKHVQSPVDQRHPVQHRNEGGTWWIKDAEWNHQEVPEDEEPTKDVPAQAVWT